MDLQKIGPDVYACLQPDRGLGCSNSGLVGSGRGLVVDTFWDLPHTRRMLELYQRVRARPVERLVNTHHNGDHCYGNQLLPEAQVIGHRLCAEAMRRDDPERMRLLRAATDSDDPAIRDFAERLAEWDFSGIQLRPPDTLLDERLRVEDCDTPIDILYVGPAHTAGDVIVHLPEHRIVFAGDILFRLCTPISWEGTFAQWAAALDKIVELEPEIIVPGHGPLCGPEGAREMKEYLTYVRAESKQHFDTGRSPLEAAQRIDLGPYASWTEPERILFSVERAYREFRGEPADSEFDAVTTFRGMYELKQHYARRGHVVTVQGGHQER